MMQRKRTKPAQWYIEQRIDYLTAQLNKLRDMLKSVDENANFEAVKDFLETRGRLRELQNIREHMNNW
ncbi:hypothetical protein [Alicyclobacillus acidoterrestris]|uniref:Uncharacterized protein n=1 Tax=Alicyclobacillus acidoterrestris (strain ATCC 49025 / DSM 3922 / CIP 106132 / NCIMB 13137 / GD3B) TaxID=1356854 RepID=T0BTK6_ALIAG|nr:hypothetical protein [Alicyclobacillus acidoterrestris]EPZ47408.1 hypothetical protein N007_06245 [Alicyclobacillus acidoterrestris ATCC 49025]UNO48305.1 hypothetical protein K1I37_16760 [Alicyclobacillus acidoterrestris]